MLSLIAFSSVIGFSFSRLGYWAPDQPFDPNNPVNPWANKFVGALGGVLGAILTAQIFGLEQITTASIGAIAGSMFLVDIARNINIIK